MWTVRAIASRHADPRWVGSGRKLYDNKGNPLRKYEPYFSTTVDARGGGRAAPAGASRRRCVRPARRAVETRFPTSPLRVRFDAWRQETWDRNDTLHPGSAWDKAAAAISPATRTSGRARWPKPMPARRRSPFRHARPADPGRGGQQGHRDLQDPHRARHPGQRSARSGTPTAIAPGARPTTWPAAVLHAVSNDAGESFALAGADGQPRHSGPRAAIMSGRITTGCGGRPQSTSPIPATAADDRTDRIVYGEAAPNAAAANLLGRSWLAFDGAGAVRTAGYDFKGNAARPRALPVRRSGGDRRLEPAAARKPDRRLARGAAGGLFEPPFASAASAFDAQNRPVMERAPDGAETLSAMTKAARCAPSRSRNLPGSSSDHAGGQGHRLRRQGPARLDRVWQRRRRLLPATTPPRIG